MIFDFRRPVGAMARKRMYRGQEKARRFLFSSRKVQGRPQGHRDLEVLVRFKSDSSLPQRATQECMFRGALWVLRERPVRPVKLHFWVL